jgi:hypothetical protein
MRRLTGYDVATELLAFRCDIPERSWGGVKEVARLSVQTERTLASHPIAEEQAREIARLLRTALPTGRMDYLIEPFAAP